MIRGGTISEAVLSTNDLDLKQAQLILNFNKLGKSTPRLLKQNQES